MSAHPEPSDKEKEIIISKNTINRKVMCAVCNTAINKKSDIEFHYIRPLPIQDKFSASEFITVCKKHHKELGELSLLEYNALNQMRKFFNENGIKRLNDVLKLKFNNDFGKEINSKILNDKNEIEITFQDSKSKINDIDINSNYVKNNINVEGNNKKTINEKSILNNNFINNVNNINNKTIKYPLYVCPSTGFKYFYAVIPINYLNNDEELQPRPLEFERLWELYRHLLVNSQLTPSVCRLTNNKILLFDGQHKAAAQIWADRKEIECKIYVEPDIKYLKETNLVAHDKLRQMPFFTSVLINKWASIFEQEWKEYMSLKGDKSELGFVSFFISKGKKKTEAINMIESNIFDSIIEDKNNLIIKYINEFSPLTKKPLTTNRLKNIIFKKFIASPPLEIDIEESDRLRELERKNIIKLLNIITKYSLQDKWDPIKNDENHKISERIYLTGSFKAWTGILKDTISVILELFDENERKELFLREITEENWQNIENCISVMFERRVWQDDSEENYNMLRLSNENQVRKYLSRRGISVNELFNRTGLDADSFVD
jgi:hypothetical protein